MTTATVSWDVYDRDDITFQISGMIVQYRVVQLNNTWMNSSLTTAGARTMRLTGLLPGTEYMFKVIVVLYDGTSSESESEHFITVSVTTISEVSLIDIRPFSAEIGWSIDNTDSPTGVYIRYKLTTSSSEFLRSPLLASSISSYTLSGLSPNNDYTFKMEIVTDAGTVVNSTQQMSFTTPALLLPHDIEVINITDTSADIVWILDEDSNVYHVIVQYHEDTSRIARDANRVLWTNSTDLPPTESSIHLSDLTPHMIYTFRILVMDKDLEHEDVTDEEKFETKTPPTIPLPRDVTITHIGPGGATVKWTMGDNTGVDMLVLQYRPSNGPLDSWINVTSLPPSSGSHDLTGLSPGSEYDIRMEVVFRDGRTRYTQPQSFETKGLPIPYDVEVTDITNTTATLTWQMDVEPYVAGIIIQYTVDGDYWFDSSFIPSGNNTTELSSLFPGTPYTFRFLVIATDQGTSVSQFYNFITLGEPSAYNIRVSDVTSVSVTISWDVPENMTVDGTIVQYRMSNTSWSNSSYIAMPNTSVILVNLSPMSKYIFRLVFTHPNTEVTTTPAYFFQTLALAPPLPIYIRVIDIQSTTATVIWKFEFTDGISGYVIQYKTTSETFQNSKFIPITRNSLMLLDLKPDSQYVLRMKVIGIEGANVFTPLVIFKTGDVLFAPASIGEQDWWMWLLIAIIILIFLICIICTVCVLCCRRKKQDYETRDKELLTSHDAKMADITYAVAPGPVLDYDEADYDLDRYALLQDIQKTRPKFWEIPRGNIRLIRILAEGKFGEELWEGQLESYGEVADVGVKRLKDDNNVSNKQILNQELDVLSRVSKHMNIVNLVGACTINGPLLIVNDDPENVRLHHWLRTFDRLHDPVRQNTPGFNVSLQVLPQLLDFAIDISKGLGFLASLKCVNHHLSTRHIIISDNLVARVTDYAIPLPQEGRYASLPRESQTPDDMRWMSYESLFYNLYSGKSNV
uniref:Receptor-type tyrosine-protein phosphatase eta-like n=1 Tax=Saccoglossus kowalevskii TaxID=10224 RepID=A0ABM0GIL4_SACKO